VVAGGRECWGNSWGPASQRPSLSLFEIIFAQMNGGGDADFNDLKRLRLRRPMAVTSIAETEPRTSGARLASSRSVGFLQHFNDFRHFVRGHPTVNDRMTIRADRAEIRDGVDNIFAPDRGQGFQMVDVNVVFGNGTIGFFKTKVADDTSSSVMRDALVTRPATALERIHLHHNAPSLRERRVGKTHEYFLVGRPRLWFSAVGFLQDSPGEF
jgi:hypothetical protein